MMTDRALDAAAAELDGLPPDELFERLCGEDDGTIAEEFLKLVYECRDGLPRCLRHRPSAGHQVRGFLAVVRAWCEYERGTWEARRAEQLSEEGDDE
jgi:hypothetical protein